MIGMEHTTGSCPVLARSSCTFEHRAPSGAVLHSWLPADEGPEGAGLVYIKTSQTAHGCGVIPASITPSRPDAFLIDQDAMRLKRLRKNVITSARYHVRDLRGQRFKACMVTLTYRDDAEWNAKQISKYLDCVKQWLKRRGHGCRYVWVYELTKRGRPHYHALFWLPKGFTMPKADKRGWWRQGMTQTVWARNAVGYLAKYASKGNGDQVISKGVRLYGIGGLSASSRLNRAWWNLPTGVRVWGFPSDRWRRAPGGGWVSRRSGEWRPSLWSVLLVAGRVFAAPRPEPKPEPFDALLQALLSVLPRTLA